jgi:trimethylamine:corrinoid methyltransferase-like protein
MDTHSRWVEKGEMDMTARAARLIDQILDNHKVEPLPADIQRDIRAVVEGEARRVGA